MTGIEPTTPVAFWSGVSTTPTGLTEVPVVIVSVTVIGPTGVTGAAER